MPRHLSHKTSPLSPSELALKILPRRRRRRSPQAPARFSRLRHRRPARARAHHRPQGRRSYDRRAPGQPDRRRRVRPRLGRVLQRRPHPLLRLQRHLPLPGAGPPQRQLGRRDGRRPGCSSADGKGCLDRRRSLRRLRSAVRRLLRHAASIRARGWDHTTYGSISATLAAAMLLNLTHEQTEHALGIASTTGTALPA